MRTYTNEVEELRAANCALIASNTTLRRQRNEAKAKAKELAERAAQCEYFREQGAVGLKPLNERAWKAEADRDRLTEEVSQLKAALELGQQNCDDAYDDLRAERDAARAEVKELVERRKFLEFANQQLNAVLATAGAPQFSSAQHACDWATETAQLRAELADARKASDIQLSGLQAQLASVVSENAELKRKSMSARAQALSERTLRKLIESNCARIGGEREVARDMQARLVNHLTKCADLLDDVRTGEDFEVECQQAADNARLAMKGGVS